MKKLFTHSKLVAGRDPCLFCCLIQIDACQKRRKAFDRVDFTNDETALLELTESALGRLSDEDFEKLELVHDRNIIEIAFDACGTIRIIIPLS